MVDFIVVIKFINFEDLLVQKNIIMCLYTTESHRSNFKVQVTPPIKIYYNGLRRYLEKKRKMRSDVKVIECENHQMDNMIYSFIPSKILRSGLGLLKISHDAMVTY